MSLLGRLHGGVMVVYVIR